MRIRRARTDDPIALAAASREAIAAAEARREPIVLEDLPPCTIGRPVRARLEPGPGPHARIAFCAACADAPACPGFLATDDRVRLSALVRPRLHHQADRRAVHERHFARLRALERLPGEPLATIERAVLDRIRPDGPTTPLELSIAWRGGRAFRYRFSSVVASRPADPIQVLFGIEASSGHVSRAKGYAMRADGRHMIGVDVGADGVVSRKLYRRRGGPAADVVVETERGALKAVDRSLLRSDLGWSWALRRVVDTGPLEELRAGATLVPTRFSTSRTDPRDVTLYYWVTE